MHRLILNKLAIQYIIQDIIQDVLRAQRHCFNQSLVRMPIFQGHGGPADSQTTYIISGICCTHCCWWQPQPLYGYRLIYEHLDVVNCNDGAHGCITCRQAPATRKWSAGHSNLSS